MQWNMLEKMQGVRTTICFLIIVFLTSAGMFTRVISADSYLEFMTWLFGIFVGARAVYKGTEVAKLKVDATHKPVD